MTTVFTSRRNTPNETTMRARSFVTSHRFVAHAYGPAASPHALGFLEHKSRLSFPMTPASLHRARLYFERWQSRNQPKPVRPTFMWTGTNPGSNRAMNEMIHVVPLRGIHLSSAQRPVHQNHFHSQGSSVCASPRYVFQIPRYLAQ